MTSVRLAYIFVVVFAATLYASGVAVSTMENFDTVSIENTASTTDAGLDSSAQRRLRGALKQGLTDEERGPSYSAGLAKLAERRNNSWTRRIAEKMKKVIASFQKQLINSKALRKLNRLFFMKMKGGAAKTPGPKK
ncbi:unnamed protein product [Peronospora destructor]|uniref:RxLR effector protein n=1 Tax=Peronospora destructor TaxID=86335 RepID=A0AAV0UXC2_9STRA|nr:unnamed protein product [Peronospora destructor]CAI5741524.1 unnamed protein product [Peronospora destructor]